MVCLYSTTSEYAHNKLESIAHTLAGCLLYTELFQQLFLISLSTFRGIRAVHKVNVNRRKCALSSRNWVKDASAQVENVSTWANHLGLSCLSRDTLNNALQYNIMMFSLGILCWAKLPTAFQFKSPAIKVTFVTWALIHCDTPYLIYCLLLHNKKRRSHIIINFLWQLCTNTSNLWHHDESLRQIDCAYIKSEWH